MSGHGDLENLILSTVERVLAGRRSERHGLVTSYDPEKYLAKVTFMPDGQESGWLPIETGHIGNGFGIAIGLTTGDGKKTGDQVIVRFQEGDFESGKIVQRVHSDEEKPPVVQSGEMVFWHQKGAKIFFAQNGSLTVQDGKGAKIVFDGQGNISDTAKAKTENFSGQHSVNVGGAHNVSIGGDKTQTIGGKRKDNVGGIWNAIASAGVWSWLMDDDG